MGGGFEPQQTIPQETFEAQEVQPDRSFWDLLMEPEVFGPIAGGLTVTVIGPLIFYFIKRNY